MKPGRRLIPLSLATIALLAGCHDDPAPDKDKKTASPVGDTQLRDAIQRPINRAKAVDDVVQKAKEQQDKDIDKQMNGEAPEAGSGDASANQ